MADLQRFSVSVDGALLEAFDRKIAEERCPTRSKAVGDLIRASLVESEWQSGDTVAGAIVLVYDHHTRGLTHRLIAIQHDFHAAILSSQHVHLDHDNCLEIIAVSGLPEQVEALLRGLKAIKGLKHVSLAAGTTGRSLD